MGSQGMDWRAQYNRMMRTHKKLDDHARAPEAYDDDLAHFLMDTLHLCDWIQSDIMVSQEKKSKVRTLFDKSEILQVSRSAANGYKHGGRDRSPQATSVDIHSAAKEIIVSASDGRILGQATNYETRDGKIFQSLELTRQAVEAWRSILTDSGLLPAPDLA